jgi:hypothetical protein
MDADLIPSSDGTRMGADLIPSSDGTRIDADETNHFTGRGWTRISSLT